MAQTATITTIKRDFNLYPNIVGISTTADLTTITTAGYWLNEMDNVELLNNGVWQWEVEDICLIFYATDLIGWFTFDATTNSFVSVAANGGISNTLPSGNIIVGNGSNVATAVTMTGDVAITNAGVTTIQPGAVTSSKIANNAVTSTQLAANTIQYERVALSNAQFLGMYATPVSIVAAGGANTAIIVERMVLETVYGTTQSAAGGAVALQYGNAAHGAGEGASATIAAATLNGDTASTLNRAAGANADNLLSAAANAAVYISNTGAAFTTGDSTYFVHVWYSIVATN
jgi:hypothetical protein